MRAAVNNPVSSPSDPLALFARDVLGRTPMTAGSREFARHLRVLAVQPGEAAALDGRAAFHVYVASGTTKLVAHLAGGREQIVAFHFSRDLIAVPARAAHRYRVQALAESVLVAIPSGCLLTYARADAAVLERLLGRVEAALQRCREKAVALGRKSAQERVADFLCAIAERIGERSGEGCEIDLPMSRRDIADSLGLTIETVSRQFTELRALGLIATSGRSRVRICRCEGLRARAGHLPAAMRNSLPDLRWINEAPGPAT